MADKLIDPLIDCGKTIATALGKKAIEEAGYLCCYQSYVDDFDDQREKLKYAVGSVHEDIKDARNRNETRIDPIVQGWLDEADGLIQQDTKSKKNWFFGLCLNCFWQNRRSKELQGKTQVIKDLITKGSNFSRVARSAESLGIELYSSPNFMRFESRKLKFEQLKEALKDVNNPMIGLQGMGGTGKTTMAIQVRKELQQLDVFDKVIFTVVSNADQPADVIKIRGDIARKMKFELKGEESEHAYQLLTRISTCGEKILIVLDDVWQKLLNLHDIGIPLGQHGKGCCSVLITTRDLRVLRDMGCQKAIQLETISEKDALNLFLSHSGKTGDDDSSNIDFKDVALRIVNECGRLPVAIVPLARALNSGSLEYWNDTLTRLQNFNPMSHDVPEDLIDAYKSLRLSYDNLKENPSAQKLFLLCSLFPEDFEIPVELLTRIAISMGLCVEADNYYIARSQVSNVQRKLFDSCLLLKVAAEPDRLKFSEFVSKATNERVKMHDLIREVALSIAKEEIQVIMDSKSTLKENIQCSYWNINGFPDRFHGGKLEFLLLMTKTNGPVQVPDGLFKGVKKLRVLILICTNYFRIPAPSLMKSTLPLENIQTMSLSNWELGDISVIGILQSLETLELINCSITELPSEVAKLKELRLLGLRYCRIESKNPFKVIERCPILEELYYVENEDILRSMDELDYIEPPATLERYHIVTKIDISTVVDDSISRWFQPGFLSKIFCEATFKSLATRAEILELISDDEDTELKVKELFRGPLPIDMVKNLVILNIESCRYLEGTLFKGKLELGNLRSIQLESCAVTFLFNTSTAQSLKKLEELRIFECVQLKCIIADERSDEAEVLDDPNQKSHGSLFNLKTLVVRRCPKLEFIFPIYFAENTQKLENVSIVGCKELEYIFGQYSNAEEGSYQIQNQVILPSLKKVHIQGAPKLSGMFPAECIVRSTQLGEDGLKEKDGSKSGTNNAFSWAVIPICCFFLKSSETLPDHTSSHSPTQMLIEAKKGFNIAGCLMGSPLNPSFVTEMTIIECFNKLTSLFTLGVASSMSLLEVLNVGNCKGLKHVVSSAEEGDDHMNHNYSIFPNLRTLDVRDCELLEDVFPASHCTKLHHLERIRVIGVPKLRYVFGECSCQNQNVEILLPALKEINIYASPDMVNICIENCFLKALSLEVVGAGKVPQHVIRPLIDFRVGKRETQDLTTRKVMEMQPGNLTELALDGDETDRIYDLEGLQSTEGPVKSRLNVLELVNLPLLTDICVGTRNILSFHNLVRLEISRCKKLQFIFSASILRSLPQLKRLEASKCPELLQIIEEDTDENSLVSQHNCFPQLWRISVDKCDKLKCLFSITECGILPNLVELTIKEAPELMQVFGCKQGDSKELNHVFPKLSYLQLEDLQSLESVCQGIDFQTVKKCDVIRCPKFSLTSTTEDTTSNNDESRAALSESKSSPPYFSEEETNRIVEDTSNRAPNTTQIQEIKEASDDEDGPKSKKSIIAYQTNIISQQSKSSQAPFVIPSKTESPQSEVTNQIVEEISKRSSNMTKIQEIEEESDQDGPKLNGSITPDQTIISEQSKSSQAPCVIPLPNISPQDTLVDEEAKKETSILGQQAQAKTTHDMHSNNSQNNTELSVGEGPSSEKDNKLISSTHLEQKIAHCGPSTSTKEHHENKSMSNKEAYGESISTKEAPKRVDKPLNDAQKVVEPTNESSLKETSGKTAMAVPPTLVKTKDLVFNPVVTSSDDTFPLEIVEASVRDGPKVEDAMIPDQTMDSKISSITSFIEPQTKTTRSDQEPRASQSNQAYVSSYTDSPQGQTIINQTEIDISEQFEEDDLFKLFRMVEEEADMEVGMPYVSKFVAVEDDNKVAKAFADLEVSLKMSLNEIASSEENSLCLQNSLNFLSAYCSEDGAPSHGLSATIGSLQKEIQSILSSFKQASFTVHAFTALEEKEKYFNEELPRRKQAAKTLLTEIYKIEKSVVEAQHNEAELKEHISRLQAEVSSKEKEIKECEIKLSSLQEQKKKSVSDTIGFIKEFEAVKKDKSQMVDEQIKARQELEKVDGKWSSCVVNLRKTTLLLGIHLNHKL